MSTTIDINTISNTLGLDAFELETMLRCEARKQLHSITDWATTEGSSVTRGEVEDALAKPLRLLTAADIARTHWMQEEEEAR